jgi:hypothetical protein
MAGMKTYRNEKFGFEIELPEHWRPAPVPKDFRGEMLQYGCPDEAINFEIGPITPEPALVQTERDFTQYATTRNYAGLKLGRILIAGKEHVCASYSIHDALGDRWNKKYMIVLGGLEYALTATCSTPEWFAQREADWDAIVGTFRLLAPVGTGETSRPAVGNESKQRARRSYAPLFSSPKLAKTPGFLGEKNFRNTFIWSLIVLILLDVSFFFPEYIAIRNVTCMRILMLLPVIGMYFTAPGVRLPRALGGIIGLALYLFFWFKTS